MRITLLAITVFVGLHIGLTAMDNFKDMQDKRMDKLCQIDSSYCK